MAARISVTSQPMVLAGLAPNLTAPTVDGDVVDVGHCFLVVNNASGSSITVTVSTPELVDGDLTILDRVVTLATAQTKHIPITSNHYRQNAASAALPADVGRAYVNYSAIASVTRGMVSM